MILKPDQKASLEEATGANPKSGKNLVLHPRLGSTSPAALVASALSAEAAHEGNTDGSSSLSQGPIGEVS